MRNGVRPALALMAVLALSGAAFAQTSDIIIVNDTGATLFFLYASPTTADSWGEDLLGDTVLPDGASFQARLRRADAFDIRAVDSNDNEYIVWNWNAARTPRVVIRQDVFVGVNTASSASALAWLNIRNETNYTIVQIVAVPASTGDWDSGESLLQSWETIHDGEDYRVEIDLDASDTFIYDIMLIDEDGDQYFKWDVNLEIVGEIIYTLDDLRFR
ncbi:MAG: hypothetical protein KOO61_06785 [Spirochaetales bacterium]|nr:hypothetical protein [Spirochaetales bacterium]